MSVIKTGGPAFPVAHHYECADGETYRQTCNGMTIRDYLAAAALHGILSSHGHTDPQALAASACRYADAVLAALEAGQ